MDEFGLVLLENGDFQALRRVGCFEWRFEDDFDCRRM